MRIDRHKKRETSACVRAARGQGRKEAIASSCRSHLRDRRGDCILPTQNEAAPKSEWVGEIFALDGELFKRAAARLARTVRK